MLDDGTPLFQQIADQLSADVVDGALVEGERVPSTNEFAAFTGSIRRPPRRASTCWSTTAFWKSGAASACSSCPGRGIG